MIIRKLLPVLFALGLFAVTPAPAEESEPDVTQETVMPEFGVPEEMQMLAPMAGTWHYSGELRMSPQDEFTRHEATAVFSMVAGGAAMQMEYTGPMLGMTMIGLGLVAYDRELGRWQETWVDNFGGRISLYTGTFENGRRVMTGTDLMAGEEVSTRFTTFNITDSTFEWTMENSLDGQEWYLSMRGVYARK